MKSILLFAFSFLFVLNATAKEDPYIRIYNHIADSTKFCTGYFSIPYCSTLPIYGTTELGVSDSTDWYLNEQFLTRTYLFDTFYAALPGLYSAIIYFGGLSTPAHCSSPNLINLSFKAPCPSPAHGFVANNISSTEATVNWDVLSCALGYKVQYRAHGAGSWVKKNISSNTGIKKLKGLSPNTAYDWKVRTKCSTGPNIFSVYSAKQTFTTSSVKLSNEDNTESPAKLLIYPNPASDFIMTDLAEDEVSYVKITDLMGKVVQARKVSDSFQPIVISSLTPGIYFIIISFGDQTRTGLFTKE